MGRDKALLRYHGDATQLERTAELLQSVCSRVYVSQRADQPFVPPANTQAIYDSVETVSGPLRGILSAMQKEPQAHWLVLACDLPFLSQATLEKLILAFKQQPPQLTAYRSSHDDLPEPLCAIYPSGSDQQLSQLAAQIQKSCPRKLLILLQAFLIDQDDPRSLDNINTVDEYESLTSE